MGKGYQILNCDDHANFLRRHGKDPADYRPDIIHQDVLLAVLDSLNKAGRVKAIFVHTQKNVLFKVSPSAEDVQACGVWCSWIEALHERARTARRSSSRWSRDRSRDFPAGARRVGFLLQRPGDQRHEGASTNPTTPRSSSPSAP